MTTAISWRARQPNEPSNNNLHPNRDGNESRLERGGVWENQMKCRIINPRAIRKIAKIIGCNPEDIRTAYARGNNHHWLQVWMQDGSIIGVRYCGCVDALGTPYITIKCSNCHNIQYRRII